MGNLNVKSHFTNTPLENAIDICGKTLLGKTEKVEGLPKIEFNEPLFLATKESFFIFNGKLYKQVDGVAVGSLLGPTLANAFLLHLKILLGA